MKSMILRSIACALLSGCGGGGADAAPSYYPLTETALWAYQVDGKDELTVRVAGTENIEGITYYKVVAQGAGPHQETVSLQRNTPEGVSIRLGPGDPEKVYFPAGAGTAGAEWETVNAVFGMPMTCKSGGPVEGGLEVLGTSYPDAVRVECSAKGKVIMTFVQYLAAGVGVVRTELTVRALSGQVVHESVLDLTPRKGPTR